MPQNTVPRNTDATPVNFKNICLYCLHDTGGHIPCPTCRCERPFNYENPAEQMALKPGTILNEASSPILMGRCLGTGGFGITYLGLEGLLGQVIAVKEFLPIKVAGRVDDKIIAHKDQEEIYKYGLGKFVEEARMLLRFQTYPNLVTIGRVFLENNTAYFTMSYSAGMTLEEYVKNKGGISQRELLDIMQEVLNGLKIVHDEDIFHRDIKPSNIYIPHEPDIKPFLLDFGSARQAMRGNVIMSVFMTPGYAPVEQYKKTEKQGAYTDIYACAATMYACMRARFNQHGTIVPPPEALDICNKNVKLEPLKKISKQPVTEEFSKAVHFGLQCQPQKRPQSIAEFEEVLGFSQITPSKHYELLGIAGEYEGVTIPLNEGPVILGRNPKKCHLVIPDHPLSQVSGKHCKILLENGKVYLQDVSRHGTTVNDSNKIHHQTTVLKPDDTLNLQGEAVFKIIQSEAQKRTPATFLQRLTAWFIDSMVITVGSFLILFVESIALGVFGILFEQGTRFAELLNTTGGIILLATLFMIPWIYNAAMESSLKQATLGKMALGISVTNLSGQRISFWRASGRYFSKIFSSLILMIGFIMPIFTKKKQALHDIIAKCLVISS